MKSPDRAVEPAVETLVPANILTPYLRVRIRVDDDALAVTGRRTLLGLVPAGRRQIDVPLSTLTSARIATALRPERLTAAVGLAAVILLTDLPLIAGLLLGALAAWLLPLSLIKVIRLRRNDGRSWSVPICWFHVFDASLALLDAERRGGER